MNFYEYAAQDDTLHDPVILAARDLISHGLQVIPLVKNAKEPANVKDVYKLISNPIHEKNFDFYFVDRDVDLGMILAADMEFLDVDEKYKPGIAQSFLKAVESGWPELYEKLVIHFTKSGGCHLLYRSEVVGGPKVLARTPKKPNPLAIIERINRNNSQYIKIPPSPGYTIYQRNPLDIQMITAEERNWLSAVAMSFNEVHIPEVKKKESEREDSPWYVFNSRNDWKYIRNELMDRGWSVVSDDKKKLTMRRPGSSDHRSSGYVYQDTNILYLHTTSTEFEDGKAYSPFGVYAMFYHNGDIGSACRQLASEGCGRNLSDEGQFWIKPGKTIHIKYTELLNWLHCIGFRKYKGSIVQVIDNIVSISGTQAMKQAFLNEVEFEVRDKMFEKVGGMFSDEGGLMAMLNELEGDFVTDGPDHTWLFFSNVAVRVSASVDLHDYKTISGLIWESDVIAREFYHKEYEGCDADKFVSILGGDRKKQLQEIIGYSISRYKDPINPRAVLIMEDIPADEEGDSQGGSGKGLMFQFIKEFRKAVSFDGKNFRPADPFLYQNIEPDTSIIFIDDVDKSFKFGQLFSIITGDLQVNKKNRPQIIIPFCQSPKIFLTSNFSIGGMDQSSRRRKYEFAVTKHFGEEHSPVDEFGRRFFSDWDKNEWLKFDNMIADCCRLYLSEIDKKQIGNITENSHERSLINNTNREFVEYMDNQLCSNFFDFAPSFIKNLTITYPNGTTITNAVNMRAWELNQNSTDYYMVFAKESFTEKMSKTVKYKNLTTTRLTQWMKRWADARKVEIDTSYIRPSDRERCYRVVRWLPTSFSNDPDSEVELPF